MFNRVPSTSNRVTLRTLVTPARVYAVTRVAIGAWLLVDPSGFGAKWFMPPQDPVLTGSIIRSVGGRDLGIGVGLLLTDRTRSWLWLCAFCDFLDAFMVFLARSRFSEQQVWSGVIGALSYGLIAVAVAEFGAWSHRRAGRTGNEASA